jgi:hypothetical protein
LCSKRQQSVIVSSNEVGQKLTISLLSRRRLSLPDLPALFEINVPGFFFTGVVLQLECEDGFTLVDGVFAFSFVGRESPGNGIEGLGGWEGVCRVGQSGQQMGLMG